MLTARGLSAYLTKRGFKVAGVQETGGHFVAYIARDSPRPPREARRYLLGLEEDTSPVSVTWKQRPWWRFWER